MITHQTTDCQFYELAWFPREKSCTSEDRATRYLNRHVDLNELMSQTLSHMVRTDRSIFGE
jgi:hypothetical protein